MSSQDAGAGAEDAQPRLPKGSPRRHARPEPEAPVVVDPVAMAAPPPPRVPGPNAGVSSPLTDAILVCEPASILAGLAREWAARDEFSVQTVIELQEALHARELARATQPLAITITPNYGFPALRSTPAGGFRILEATQPLRGLPVHEVDYSASSPG